MTARSQSRRCLALSMMLVGIGWATPPEATAKGPFAFATARTTLESGLRILAIRTGPSGVFSLATVVGTGSGDERPGQEGLASLMERLLGVPSGAKAKQSGRGGVEPDAERIFERTSHTALDGTFFHVFAPIESLDDVVSAEAKRFIGFQFEEGPYRQAVRAAQFQAARKAFVPAHLMVTALHAHAFTSHGYQHPTYGSLDSLQSAETAFAVAQSFARKNYTPSNVTVIVAGDIDPEATVSLCKEAFASWATQPNTPKAGSAPSLGSATSGAQQPQTSSAPTIARRSVSVEIPRGRPGAARPALLMGCHVPAFSASDRVTAATDVLATLLFSENAPLYEQLVKKEGAVAHLDAWNEPRRQSGLFTVYAEAANQQSLSRAHRAIRLALSEAAQYGDSGKNGSADQNWDGRIEAEAAHLKFSLFRELRGAQSVGRWAARLAALGLEPEAINQYTQQLEKVTGDDVARVARLHLNRDNCTAVRLIASTARPGFDASHGKTSVPESPRDGGTSQGPAQPIVSTPAAPAAP